ncbi:UDP-rhamnose/UDP-galactose transporter 3-like [Zingiber officinale]|uniref:UDP-rhamnose/UDP-galactose transporter 3-like n=1 Tax=Zingiber officinale TaxID=94328 RepID=UPI001C4BFD70|nr:UDP-rhamnose/UDP-galactose transporter 3-like [Zingiber officinale]
MDAGKKKPVVSDAGAWAMNVVSAVGLIMANKRLMSNSGYAFSFATTLTGFHFTVTAIVGWISNATGLSVSKHVPLWELLWFSIVANMSITGMNLSLMLNSVGFYQISKLSIIPVVCLMEFFLHSKHYSSRVIMAVTAVALGVGICTVTDVEVKSKGLVCACVAVFCTSLQQITIGSLQKKYDIGSFELLSKTAPIQAISLLLFGPTADYYLNGHLIFKYHYSIGAFLFILLSCILAVFCNTSQYLCIGRFSATSFQVLGHMKTVCVLILGWLLFDSALTLKNILGMLLAVLGMVFYSWEVEHEKKAKLASDARIDSVLAGEDARLLGKESGASKYDIELSRSES